MRTLIGFTICIMFPCIAAGAYIQNFDGLTPGSIKQQDGWSGGTDTLVQSSIAKSGQALVTAANANSFRTVFGTYAQEPRSFVQYDFYLPHTISEYAGLSNRSINSRVDTHGSASAPSSRDTVFQYAGNTNSFGTVTGDAFMLATALGTIRSTGAVQAGQWYHFFGDMNWANGQDDVRITNPDGTTFWDPAPYTRTGGSGSDASLVIFSFFGANPPHQFYIDNLSITTPEPASLSLIAVCALGILRRRR